MATFIRAAMLAAKVNKVLLVPQVSKSTYKMPVITSATHLAQGSSCPPLREGLVRFYNMKYCPFAQRTLIVLNAKNVQYDMVNVHLKQKPDWFIQKNPLGKVPILELEDKIVFESNVTCDYLDEIYPDPPLYPADPHMKFVEKSWIEMFVPKFVTPIHRIYYRSDQVDKIPLWIDQYKSALHLYENELQRRNTVFFGGDKPGMLDYSIWPWFERLSILSKLLNNESLKPDEHPALGRYVDAIQQDEAVRSTILSPEEHFAFIQTLIARNPDYDMEFVKPKS